MPYLACLLLFFLTACGGIEGRIEQAQTFADQHDLTSKIIPTTSFPIFAAHPKEIAAPLDVLKIVIEGDGYAFVSRSQVSGDPTPKHPIGLYLAVSLDPGNFYLGRACQYVRNDICAPPYWSTRRFSPETMGALSDAITALKTQYGHPQSHIELIGYSGGGYAALYLAAQREDITKVTTVAGLIAPEDWADYHHITPLILPSNSETLFKQTTEISFVHICGEQDKVIPCAFSQHVLQKYTGLNNNHRLIPIKGAHHSDLWNYAKPYL